MLFFAGMSLGRPGRSPEPTPRSATAPSVISALTNADTMRARGHAAQWRGAAGDPAGAATEYEKVLADGVRVFGVDHPDTITARGNVARWRGAAGDAAGAARRLLEPWITAALATGETRTMLLRNRAARRPRRRHQRPQPALEYRDGRRARQPDKMLKRQMYGRAGPDLLRRRILLAD